MSTPLGLQPPVIVEKGVSSMEHHLEAQETSHDGATDLREPAAGISDVEFEDPLDPADPKNFSSWWKWSIVGIVSTMSTIEFVCSRPTFVRTTS